VTNAHHHKRGAATGFPSEATPALQLSNIGTSVTANESDPVYTTQVLHFSTDLKQVGGPRGKKLYIRVTVPELITLLSYLSRHSAMATA